MIYVIASIELQPVSHDQFPDEFRVWFKNRSFE